MHLSFKNISKSFGPVKAIRNVNLDLLPGEVHAVCGENGAGKSTLMNILSGNLQADAGELFINGQSTRLKNQQHAAKLGIAIVYQHLSLFENLDVAENIFVNRFPQKSIGTIDHRHLYRSAGELLKQLNIDHIVHPHSTVSSLSAGQKQMVEIAKALSNDPKVLILDEPTASLTNDNKHTLFAIIRLLKNTGTSIIYISHRMEEIFEVSDRVTVLKDGKWVTTMPTGTLTKEKLVSLMVGREIKAYKKRIAENSELLFEVQNLNNDIIRNISFKIYKGEILAMSGLVGAGRTEIAKTVFGAMKKKSGALMLQGKAVHIDSPGDAIRHRIVYLPEERKALGLFLDMSIEDNINATRFTSPLSTRINYSEAAKTAEHYKNRLRIVCTCIAQKVSELSGGNQQKVVLAKWLSMDPDVLIIDEPTHGIDIGAKFEIYELLQELAASGKAILMISSELPEILAISDRVLVIKEGTIVKELATSDTTEEELLGWAM